ncbi:hypothetical protein ACN28G_13015 [Micromonospora sp. WMMA1923]|uniref:hypothetical protein n=1 Tax=Micromonospora sp. WMMA1923 TaxID=3404125 RepID=UPI003B935847
MIRPEFPDYIRTLVRGEHAANDAIEARLQAEGWDGFPKFLAMAFFLAVDLRFGENAEWSDVIKFVADLRTDLHGGAEINAEAAERLIMSVVDPSVDYTAAQEMIGAIQAATALKILAEANLTDTDLDSLLAEAVTLTDRP